MEPSKKPIQKPLLSSQKKISTDSYEKKLSKIDIYYRYAHPPCRYHLSSIFRQLKMPVYEKLTQLRKESKGERMPEVKKSVEEIVEVLYKYVGLNSKYRHREKMRFDRTPLLKYLKCTQTPTQLILLA